MNKYIICEDEVEQANYLEKFLRGNDKDCEILIFNSGLKLLEKLESLGDDLIFLMDIKLKDSSGIDIAKEINRSVKNSAVIFISAFLEKVTEIYDATHCYFVYKQDLEKKLPLALERAARVLKEIKKMITIKTKEGILLLNISEIRYIERIQRTSFIYCSSGIYQCPQKVEFFMKNLSENFIQTHRSYIVNLNSVRVYKRSDFTLYDGSFVPISRAYTNNVKTKFHNYIMNKVQHG